MKKSLALLFLLFFNFIISQQDTTDLKEVIVSTTKLEIPFSKNFRTVKIISSDYIKNSPASNVSDLLQEITGIDVRRRGVGGVQGDLYIRGGGFDQTLLLVDGMKMDDAQTRFSFRNGGNNFFIKSNMDPEPPNEKFLIFYPMMRIQ